ncbi:MAG: HlyD family efflux transporter periplasmic adaptor subunit [Acidobacteria bacterium]|nr:MAG: HlyD family efflux transporter periplasmic adaptor subunit [Acidobacteriota bacterium]
MTIESLRKKAAGLRPYRNRLVLLALAVLVAVAAFAWFRAWSRSTDKPIRVSGNIEVTDAELSFKIPGRVDARLVDEGQMVKSGEIVALLDNRELSQEVARNKAAVEVEQAALAALEAGSRPEEIAEARAAASQAKSRLQELEAGSRPQEIAAAEAAYQSARADAKRLADDFDRYIGLYRKQLVSTQQYDAARTASEMAGARERQAKEQLDLLEEGPRKEEIAQARDAYAQAGQRYTLVKIGPRREDIEQARARLDQARESLALSETRLGYATLVSPMSGMVLSKSIEPGEYVSGGTPIVAVADLVNVWLRAYMNETDLGRVKLGQPVSVTTDTYPGKVYDGRISFISSQAEFTPKSVQTEKVRVKLVYRIKVDIKNPNMELKPGMPADAEILTGDR